MKYVTYFHKCLLHCLINFLLKLFMTYRISDGGIPERRKEYLIKNEPLIKVRIHINIVFVGP